jgi:UDP-glucose 4-epimerase
VSQVLVTGAAGLIGRELLASAGEATRFVALTRAPIAHPHGTPGIVADLRSPSFVDALPAAIDTVVHLAQSPAYRDFPDGALDVFDVNVASTARLLDWGRRAGIKRFVLASAGGAGNVQNLPLGFYLASRRSAELLASSYHHCFDVVVLRFYFVYGREQRSTMLVPRLIESVKSGTAITLAGADGIRLTPTHVSDAARAVIGALAVTGTHIIDVGGPEVLTLRTLAEVIAGKVGRAPVFERGGQTSGDLIADTGQMRTLLGAPPRREFHSGVDDLLA